MSDRATLVICRHSPYGSAAARSALDAALAAAAFEQPIDLLFLGDGVLQLAESQDGRAGGQRDMGKLLASFPLYDIEQVYAEARALRHYGMAAGPFALSVIPLEQSDLQALLNRADHLLGF